VICEEKQGWTGNPVSSWAQKTLEPGSTSSASITHRDTEGKFTEAYSTSKYTPSGLKLYSTRENGDKPNIVSTYSEQGETKVCASRKMPKYLKQKVHPMCACACLHIQQYEYRKPPGVETFILYSTGI